jgi:Cu2+-exporting ATPase
MMPAPGNAACFHCSESLPADDPCAYSDTHEIQTRYFCCPACRSVTLTIESMGLGAYYRQRDNKAMRAQSTHPDWYEMDLPSVRTSYIQTTPDDTAQTDLLVPDIHCAACCWLLEHALLNMPGVLEARAQLAQQKVFIRWTDSALRPSQLFSKLADIGYHATPWQNNAQHEALQARQAMLLRRTGVAGLAAMQIHMIAMGNYLGAGDAIGIDWEQWMNGFALLLSIPVWFYAATPFFSSAWRHLRSGTLGMDFPVSLAIITAAAASLIALWQRSSDVYFDSIAMFVFILLGARFLETRARSRLTRHSQPPLMPQSCLRQVNGLTERVAITDLSAGDHVVSIAGECIPVDGIVLEGMGSVEEALLTGESIPVHKQTGETVLAGTTLHDGHLLIQARQWGHQSRLLCLHQQMEQGLQSRHTHSLHDRIARWFTPVILLVALASGLFWALTDPDRALPAVLAVLVASCPCALSIAIPAARAAATLQLRQRGILVTADHVLLSLHTIRCWVFDKTGTLTTGQFSLLDTQALHTLDRENCKNIATALEAHSLHPMASAFSGSTDLRATNVRLVTHHGVEGTIDRNTYRIGSPAWFKQPASPDQIQLLLGDDTHLLARFTVGDSLRNEAHSTLHTLQTEGVHCAILTGDTSTNASEVARLLSINDIRTGCSPDEKTIQLQKLRDQYGPVCMTGDGINDGPVLASADISISLAEASSTARLAADVLLLNNRLSDIDILRSTASRTHLVARQNVTWAFVYNLGILPLAASGSLPPSAAAAGMALSSLLVTLNALRLFRPTDNRAVNG